MQTISPDQTEAKVPGANNGGASSQPPTKHHMRWQLIYEVPVLLVVGLLLLDLFFNFCGVGLEEILQPDLKLGMRHLANKHVVWRMEGYSDDHFNSTGMRDVEHAIAKPAGVYRIALLGDSATEGLQVPLEATYARQLERAYRARGINAEVLNFGCSGYSTGQEVLQYEHEIAQYKPDLTILLYNRGDGTENTRKPWELNTEPRPFFYFDSTGVLKEDRGVIEAHKDAFKTNAVTEYLRNNSRIYGVLSHANLNLTINEALFRKIRGWMFFSDSARLKKEGKATCAYNIQEPWKVTSALVDRLNNDCQETGSKFFVLVFPNINNDPEYASQIPKLETLSKQRGFDYLDLTVPFHWHPNPMTFFVKYHFSDKGHEFVAAKLFEYLEQIGHLKP